MFKNWAATYYRGGCLFKTHTMTKREATRYMLHHIDGHSILKVKGFNKGVELFRYPRPRPIPKSLKQVRKCGLPQIQDILDPPKMKPPKENNNE